MPPAPGGIVCGAKFMGGRPPAIPAAQARDAVPLCYSFFAVLHSPKTRTPLWAAETLDAASVRNSRGMERVDEFHPEAKLRMADRAELADYRRSGLDRGHLAPSGDMPDAVAQEESFTLANMVPQNPKLNRGSWAELESDVRATAVMRGTTYVVTGVLFEGGEIRAIPKRDPRVLVPTSMWKAVAIPGRGGMVATATNMPKPSWSRMSVGEFEKATGIDPFPALSRSDRAKTLKLEN